MHYRNIIIWWQILAIPSNFTSARPQPWKPSPKKQETEKHGIKSKGEKDTKLIYIWKKLCKCKVNYLYASMACAKLKTESSLKGIVDKQFNKIASVPQRI